MGKVATTPPPTEMKKRKKKGRPSLIDLQNRALQQQNPKQQISISPPNNRRSTRQNPSTQNDDVNDNDNDDDDDDDERTEKKVKLVVRLPQHFPQDQGEEKVLKVTHNLHGSPLVSGPTTPLPGKKLLVFILERLQKKDTHGVFSEPVDPDELPDYHEVIEHPMDFGTVKKKLDDGVYLNLEELEADVFLICSNAMQYNSPDTIYYRQARSIQELAKRDFENLRQEGDNGELQPKVVRRGRPPTKHLKKPVVGSPVDRVGPEQSSGATLATAEDNSIASNAYNLRKGPTTTMYRFQSTDASVTSHRPRNGENYSEWLANWNDEFPASILKADMKYGNKQFSLDETRRDTYKQFHPSACGPEPYMLSGFGGDMKQLMPVGLHYEHGYARSLARFAANLGPVVWKIASKKFERVLPSGAKSGPGLVRENDSSTRTSFFSSEKPNSVLSLPGKDMIEGERNPNSQNELGILKSCFSEPGSSFQTADKNLHHPDRNGLKGAFGYNLSSQLLNAVPRNGNMEFEEPNFSESSSVLLQSGNLLDSGAVPESLIEGDVDHSREPSWQVVSQPVPFDMNVRLQMSGSPSSGLRIGSPQQPDLVLQL